MESTQKPKASSSFIMTSLANLATFVFMAMWLLAWMAPAGNPDAGVVLKAILVAAAVAGSLMFLCRMALTAIPSLKGQRRTIAIATLLGAYGLFSVAAITGTGATIGRPAGEAMYLEDGYARMRFDLDARKEAIRLVYERIPLLDDCVLQASSQEVRERVSGAISGQRNNGPITLELMSIANSCTSARSALIDARPTITALLDSMDARQARIRRILDRDGQSAWEKQKLLVKASEDQAKDIRALALATATEPLAAAAKALSKDRAPLGFDRQISATLRAQFEPTAGALSNALESLREVLDAPFEPVKPVTNPAAYLWLYTSSLWPGLALGFAIESAALLVIVIFLLRATTKDEDGPTSSSSDRSGAEGNVATIHLPRSS